MIDETDTNLLFNMQNDSLRIAVASSLAFIGLVSVPAASTLVRQLTTREYRPEVYEDEDGKATPQSLKAYSAKWPKTLMVLFAIISCGTSIATAILTTLHVGKDGLFLENWLGAGATVSYNATSTPPYALQPAWEAANHGQRL